MPAESLCQYVVPATCETDDMSLSAGIAPSTNETLESVIRELGADGRLVHVERMASRRGTAARPSAALPDGLLERVGIEELWSHQADAYDRVVDGESVAVATGTGSGKSLVYQLAVADAIAKRPSATSLVMYPTKALAQSQLRSFASLGVPDLVPATHDGDTPPDRRLWIRRNANVVLTNPEMLHVGILPNHQRWSTFLSQLHYIVVDELHVLRGIFGTHVGHILRRLLRVAAHHGAKPTFIFTSGTIGEPEALASDLIGSRVVRVDGDASPQPERIVALWSGQAGDPEVTTTPNVETAYLASEFINRGHRTLSFCRSRQGTEAITDQIRERLPVTDHDRVCSYRGGYLPAERREIEDQLFDGRLKGVVATSALELGIDIGDLDVAIVNGFPGTIASFRQQIGRVGRREQSSLAVLVAGSDQLDQWFVRNPEELFSRPPERAVINPDNPFVLRPHLACASHELPISAAEDHELWGDALDDGVRDLAHVDLVSIRNRRAMWNHPSSPAREFGLRSGGIAELRIIDENQQLIGTIDASRATSQVHTGARYLHLGQPWEITELDLHGCTATARPDDRGKTRTHALSKIGLDIVEQHQQRELGPWQLHHGMVNVSEHVTRYQLKDRSGRVLDDQKLDLPPSQLFTTAFWVTIDPGVAETAGVAASLPGSLHAMEHAAIGVLPLFTICDRWDVGGVSIAHHPQTGLPTVFIHDGAPGGSGVAQLGYERSFELFEATARIIESCECDGGCPGCVVSPKCGNGNEPLDKAGALALLGTLVS